MRANTALLSPLLNRWIGHSHNAPTIHNSTAQLPQMTHTIANHVPPPYRSGSSYIMTELMTWRNQNGREEHWINAAGSRRVEKIHNVMLHATKLILAECILPMIALAAIIDACAHVIIISYGFIMGKKNLQDVGFQLLQSSSFTFFWALGNAVFCSFPGWANISTNESLARQYTPFFRIVDELEVSQLRRVPPATTPHTESENVDIGAQFFIEHILKEADEPTRTRIQELHEDMFIFVLTKTVFIYAVGSKKQEAAPDFLREETRACLKNLREQLSDLSPSLTEELTKLVNDPDHAEDKVRTPQKKAVMKAFNKLRKAAHLELRNSLFITQCWQQACL